jgi:hypothetical protein
MLSSHRNFRQTTALAPAVASAHAQSSADDFVPVSTDTGRQLLVDDFLIAEQSNLRRTFHKSSLDSGNPILRPETPVEMNGGLRPAASPFNDGVWSGNWICSNSRGFSHAQADPGDNERTRCRGPWIPSGLC